MKRVSFNAELERRQQNPDRSPAWRWELLVEWIATGRRIPGGAHPFFREAAVYWRAVGRAVTPYDVQWLRSRMPVIGYAHEIHVKDTSYTALKIQARLRAGVPHDVIAAGWGTLPEVITAYNFLFYDLPPVTGGSGNGSRVVARTVSISPRSSEPT